MATELKKDALFIFRLTFGNVIACTDTGNQPEQLQLEQGVRREFSDKTNTFFLLLRGIKINRKIYQPTEIEAELDISQKTTDSTKTETTVPKMSDVTDLLLQREVKIELVEVDRIPDTTRTLEYKDKTLCTIAKNCYVYEVDPQLKHDTNGMKMYVKLSIFSMDKLMTLNKYSKAYVARKLGAEILQPESLLFGVASGTTESGAPLVQSDIKGMQHLMYADDKDNNKRKEFIHPYLVQYNESFYDFLVRTSNRCGEFLFFENGKLTLGLPDKDTAVKIEDFETVTLQKKSFDPMVIEDYARDSVKKEGEGGLGKLNQHVVEPFYPNGFPEKISSNAEYTSDDYMFLLAKDKFSNLARELYYDGNGHQIAMAHLIPFFKNILGNESAGIGKAIGGSLAKAFLVGEGLQSGLAFLQQGNANKAGNAAYIDTYKNKPDQSHDNGNIVAQFAATIQSSWTTLDYYKDIHKKEAMQQRQIVCINMGTSFIDLKLGQKITIKDMDGTYIVIQIKQNSEEAWSRDYEKYGDEGASDKYSGKRSLKIYAIPVYTETDSNGQINVTEYYPPVQPVPIIRRSGPQTAFVADNVDPKYQGRVRIAFPWQSLGGADRNELEKVNKNLQALDNKINELTEKKENLSALQSALSRFVEELKKYVNASKEERQQMYEDKNSKLQNLINEVQKLEADKDRDAARLDELKKKEELTEEEETTMATLETTIPMQEKELKDKNVEIKRIQEELNALKEVAEEDKRRRGNPDYTKPEDDNSVIQRYKNEYSTVSQKYREADADLKRAQDEQKKQEEKRETLAAKVDKEVKDMSTPWVRVVSPMATPGGGTFFRPRVGDEVLVNFENGNVERPYVMGSLYSKNVMTPDEHLYRKNAPELQWKDISMSMMSPNGHHITFTDPPGGGSFISNLISPGIGFYASVIPGLSKLNGMGAQFKDLNGGIHIGDRYGLYEIEMRSNKRSIDIKSPFGTVSINAFSGITISAPNGDVMIKGQNITLEAGNKVTILSGKNVKDPEIEDPLGKGNKAGAKVVSILGGAIAEGAAPKFIESTVDFSVIRKVIETFVRPVDGTMLLKSKRYLKIEAGHGNATIKSNRFKEQINEKNITSEVFFQNMLYYIKEINTSIDTFYQGIETLWKDGCQKRKTYESMAKAVLENELDPDLTRIVKNTQEWTDDTINDETFENKLGNLIPLLHLFNEDSPYNDFIAAAKSYGKAMFDLWKYIEGMKDIFNDTRDFACGEDSLRDLLKTKALQRDMIANRPDSWKNDFFDDFLFANELTGQEKLFFGWSKKSFKRKLILCFLYDVAKTPYNLQHKIIRIDYTLSYVLNTKTFDEEHYWKRQITNMDHYWQYSKLWRTLVESTWNKLKDKFKSNFVPFDYKIWEDAKDGQILFSDQADSTLNFEGPHLKSESDANIGTMEYMKKILMGIK